jgi:hypothetical protein
MGKRVRKRSGWIILSSSPESPRIFQKKVKSWSFGLYANAHRGKVRKSEEAAHPLVVIAKERPKIPGRGWTEMIRKVYEADPLVCPKCGGEMKVIAFLTDFSVVDRIINHLKLTFVAERPPPPRAAYQEVLIAAETPAEYFS